MDKESVDVKSSIILYVQEVLTIFMQQLIIENEQDFLGIQYSFGKIWKRMFYIFFLPFPTFPIFFLDLNKVLWFAPMKFLPKD